MSVEDIVAYINDPKVCSRGPMFFKDEQRTIEITQFIMAQIKDRSLSLDVRRRFIVALPSLMPVVNDTNAEEVRQVYEDVLEGLAEVMSDFNNEDAVWVFNRILKPENNATHGIKEYFCQYMLDLASQEILSGNEFIGLRYIRALEGIVNAFAIADFMDGHRLSNNGIKTCISVMSAAPVHADSNNIDHLMGFLRQYFDICPSECSLVIANLHNLEIDEETQNNLLDMMSRSPHAYHIARLEVRLLYSPNLVEYMINVMMINIDQAMSDSLEDDLDLDILIHKFSDSIDNKDAEDDFHHIIENKLHLESKIVKLSSALLYGFVCRCKNATPDPQMIEVFDNDESTKFKLAAMFNIEESLPQYVDFALQLALDENPENRFTAHEILSRLRSIYLQMKAFDFLTQKLDALINENENFDEEKAAYIIEALDSMSIHFKRDSDQIKMMLIHYLENNITHQFVPQLINIVAKLGSIDDEMFQYIPKLVENNLLDEALMIARTPRVCYYNDVWENLVVLLKADNLIITPNDKRWIIGMCQACQQDNIECVENIIPHLVMHYSSEYINDEAARAIFIGVSLIFDTFQNYIDDDEEYSVRKYILDEAGKMRCIKKNIDFSFVPIEQLVSCYWFAYWNVKTEFGGIRDGSYMWEHLNDTLKQIIHEDIDKTKRIMRYYPKFGSRVILRQDIKETFEAHNSLYSSVAYLLENVEFI